MQKRRGLLQNTIWLYVVTGVKLVAPLVTLPYLTRALSIGAYGTVSYVKAYCTYVQLLIDFGFLLSATSQIVMARNDMGTIGSLLSVPPWLVSSYLCFAVTPCSLFCIFFHAS